MFPAQSGIDPALWRDWRWQRDNSLNGADAALGCRGVTGSDAAKLCEVVERYPFLVTPYYLSLACAQDENDPILCQCVPSPLELKCDTELATDPFEEAGHSPVSRVIHRYPDRVVIITTGQCAVYCRHCTRKNVLAEAAPAQSMEDFDPAIHYIAGKPGIREVIVSGGDPLLLDMEILDDLLGSLHCIDHIESVRIGTRLPVTLPMRIDESLCAMLASHRPLWINTQFNHPVELTREAVTACDRLLRHGIPVSNQSVLLKGVNDRYEIMLELCNRLQRCMIRPYYVFQCDPVTGAGHFATDPRLGIEMEAALRKSTGGLAVPCFVADLPGSMGKTPLVQLAQPGGNETTESPDAEATST